MRAKRSVRATTVGVAISLFLVGGSSALLRVSSEQTIKAEPSKVENGMSSVTFDTPNGKITWNMPEDAAASETITGTVIAEPAPGRTPEETAQNQDELNGYVVEIEKAEEAAPEPAKVAAQPEAKKPAEEKPKEKPKYDPVCDAKQKLLTIKLPKNHPLQINLKRKPDWTPSYNLASNPVYNSGSPSHASAPLHDATPAVHNSAPLNNSAPRAHSSAPIHDAPAAVHKNGGALSDPAPGVKNAGTEAHGDRVVQNAPSKIDFDPAKIRNAPAIASTPINVPAKPASTAADSGNCNLPQIGQCGRPIQVKCDGCSGYPSDNSVMVGDRQCEPLAMGPRSTIVKSPRSVVGPATITFKKDGKVAKGEFHNIGVKLSCPNPVVKKGQTTTLTVTVFGLSGMTQPLKLTLINRTPNVIDVEGGNQQTITINPNGSDSQTVPVRPN